MLQVMVWMLAQLAVPGQQRADDELSREMQLLPEAHLKSLGSLESTAEHCEEESSRVPRSARGLSGLAEAEALNRTVDKRPKSGKEQTLEVKCMAEKGSVGLGGELVLVVEKVDKLYSRQL